MSMLVAQNNTLLAPAVQGLFKLNFTGSKIQRPKRGEELASDKQLTGYKSQTNQNLSLLLPKEFITNMIITE